MKTVAADVPNDILVSSFEQDALREVRAETSLPTALLFSRWWRRSLRAATKLDCAAIHPRYDMLSRERVEAAHERGFAVNAWTVPDRETVQRLGEWGVDGVIVDDPKIAAD